MAHTSSTQIRYTGAVPGADSDTYVILDTSVTNSWPESFFAMHGIRKFQIDVKHDEAFTFNWYKSNDRGTSWEQMQTSAVPLPASTVTSTLEIEVSALRDFKLEVVNGGTAQLPWDVDMVLIDERSVPG